MALPLLVLPSGFGSGAGSDSLDIVYSTVEDDYDQSECWRELYISKTHQDIPLFILTPKGKDREGQCTGTKDEVGLPV